MFDLVHFVSNRSKSRKKIIIIYKDSVLVKSLWISLNVMNFIIDEKFQALLRLLAIYHKQMMK